MLLSLVAVSATLFAGCLAFSDCLFVWPVLVFFFASNLNLSGELDELMGELVSGVVVPIEFRLKSKNESLWSPFSVPVDELDDVMLSPSLFELLNELSVCSLVVLVVFAEAV